MKTTVNPVDHLGLVRLIAKRYRGLGLEWEDIEGYGHVGLMLACERFKPELGYKFPTYAQWWIRQSIIRAIETSVHLIKVPVEYQAAIRSGKTADTNAPMPRKKYLADAEKVIKGGTRLGWDLESEIADTREIYEDRTEDVETLLAQLPKRHAKVLRLRYGISDKPPLTYRELGEIFKVSKERARIIEKTALAKLNRIAARGHVA